MARNEEKAQSMLNRWLRYKADKVAGESGLGGAPERRPFRSSEVDNVADCNRWRRQIIRDIATKVAQIQNGGLGEHRIRDLNDEINKLLRERYHWEKRLKELGGADHSRAARQTDADGKVIRGDGGYQYFGAARELPGVKELLEKKEAMYNWAKGKHAQRLNRGQLYKMVDANYYAFQDESTDLLHLEKLAEQKVWRDAVSAHQAKYGPDSLHDFDFLVELEQALADGVPQLALQIPSKLEIQTQLLARKKDSLLAKLQKCGSDDETDD